MMQRAMAGIVASGSATLEAAWFRLPFVLIYKVSWLTYLAGRLVVKVDCDGYKSPRQGWWRFFQSSYTILRDTHKPLPALQAALKTILFGVFPGIHDLPMLRHLSAVK